MPPGQHVVADFPVLSAGPTPHTPVEAWSLEIDGEIDEPRRWSWEEFRALPTETFTTDIHCVTSWSKLGTSWTGVSPDVWVPASFSRVDVAFLKRPVPCVSRAVPVKVVVPSGCGAATAGRTDQWTESELLKIK